jgi:prefoldin subunit 5
VIKRDYKFEIEKLEKKLEKTQSELNEKDSKIKSITQDLRNACQSNLTLMDEKEKYERDIKVKIKI